MSRCGYCGEDMPLGLTLCGQCRDLPFIDPNQMTLTSVGDPPYDSRMTTNAAHSREAVPSDRETGA